MRKPRGWVDKPMTGIGRERMKTCLHEHRYKRAGRQSETTVAIIEQFYMELGSYDSRARGSDSAVVKQRNNIPHHSAALGIRAN